MIGRGLPVAPFGDGGSGSGSSSLPSFSTFLHTASGESRASTVIPSAQDAQATSALLELAASQQQPVSSTSLLDASLRSTDEAQLEQPISPDKAMTQAATKEQDPFVELVDKAAEEFIRESTGQTAPVTASAAEPENRSSADEPPTAHVSMSVTQDIQNLAGLTQIAPRLVADTPTPEGTPTRPETPAGQSGLTVIPQTPEHSQPPVTRDTTADTSDMVTPSSTRAEMGDSVLTEVSESSVGKQTEAEVPSSPARSMPPMSDVEELEATKQEPESQSSSSSQSPIKPSRARIAQKRFLRVSTAQQRRRKLRKMRVESEEEEEAQESGERDSPQGSDEPKE